MPSAPGLLPDHVWLDRECRRLLEFGRALPHPDGGAAWLDDRGQPDLTQGVHTWITARTVHVYAVAQLLGFPGADVVADAALSGLTGVLHDEANGGWFTQVADERPAADRMSGRPRTRRVATTTFSWSSPDRRPRSPVARVPTRC